ncbi:winged helix-turn-helix domain-containing protein [Chloroflexota bacterium]
MKLNNRRSNIDIIADMLRLGEAGKTEIMYSANMSYFQLQKYLKFLLQMKLIDKVTVGNPTVTYRVTKKGLRLLRNIDSIQQILQTSDEI